MNNRKLIVAPSMLSADASRLGEEVRRIEKAGADWIHLDVMDGHFVPNITIGPFVVAALRSATRLPFDVHLMIEHPEKYVGEFVKAGADRVTVHAEACSDLKSVVRQVKQLKAKVGVALRPATPVSTIDPCLDELDLVLMMTVNPGFGGQAFMPEVLTKIEALRRRYDGHIQVDGGINHDTAKQCAQAGADVFVAGTYIFRATDPAQAILALRGQAPAPAQRPSPAGGAMGGVC